MIRFPRASRDHGRREAAARQDPAPAKAGIAAGAGHRPPRAEALGKPSSARVPARRPGRGRRAGRAPRALRAARSPGDRPHPDRDRHRAPGRRAARDRRDAPHPPRARARRPHLPGDGRPARQAGHRRAGVRDRQEGLPVHRDARRRSIKAIAAAYDAKERGERHYLGPRVPAETLRHLGIDPAVPASPPAPEPGAGPADSVEAPPPLPPLAATRASEPPSRPAIIVDEAVATAARDSEVSTSDFGALGQEVSTIAQLPDELRVRATNAANAITAGGGQAGPRRRRRGGDPQAPPTPPLAEGLPRRRGRPRPPRPSPREGPHAGPHHPRRHAAGAPRLRHRAAHQGQREVRAHPHHHGERRLPRPAHRRRLEAELRRRGVLREALPDRPS